MRVITILYRKATRIAVFDLKILNDTVTDSAEKYYENLEQNNLFDSPDEDEVEDFTNEIGGISL